LLLLAVDKLFPKAGLKTPTTTKAITDLSQERESFFVVLLPTPQRRKLQTKHDNDNNS
jgi:hypothetical protein